MTAQIIPFPIDRHVYFIRETARCLTLKQGEAANRFWQMTCRRLYARLQVQGLNEDAICAEVNAFAQAVYSEIERQHPSMVENPKGAA